MAHLAILQPDARAAARLAAALGGTHGILPCPDWSTLERTVAERSVDGCLVDGEYPDGDSAIASIRSLRRHRPDLAVVVYIELGGRSVDTFQLGGLGVHGVLLAGPSLRDQQVRQIVDHALSESLAAGVVGSLEGRASELTLKSLAWAVVHAPRRPTVPDLAAALDRTPGGLAAKLRRSGMPPPSRILLWGRLLRAAQLLARGPHTVEDVAYRLHYASGTALSRAMKRETGFSPTEIVRRGGVAGVMAALFPRGGPRWRQPRAPWRWVSLLLLSLTQPGWATLGVGARGVDRSAIDRVADRPPLGQLHRGVLAPWTPATPAGSSFPRPTSRSS